MNAATELSDKGQFNRYFAMMLHIDDDDLDPFEYKLLGHYRKVCGLSQQNVCFEANETTAKATKMSVAKVREARKALEKKGCIQVAESDGRPIRVTIADRTAENVKRYSDKTPTKNVRATKNVTPTKKITPHESGRSDLPKTSPDKELKNLIPDTLTNVRVSDAPTSAPIGKDVPKLPEPPKGNAWVSSSETGTTLAHLVKSDKIDTARPLCKASIKHRNKYSAALGPRTPCADCLKAAEPKPKAVKEPEPWSALTKAMHEATPEDIRPVSCFYAKHDKSAHALFDAGFTPERIKAFVEATYPTYRDWAKMHDKPALMSMNHVEQYIKAWEATKGKQVAPIQVADLPGASDEETAAYLERLSTANGSRSIEDNHWLSARSQLQVQLKPATFNGFVQRLRLVTLDKGPPAVYTFEATNDTQKDWIMRHLVHSLTETLAQLRRCEVRVEITVAAGRGA